MVNAYRIEYIQVPAATGIAKPEDLSRPLGARRIVHVLQWAQANDGDSFLLTVLTEESTP
jgi:hypothetical protein